MSTRATFMGLCAAVAALSCGMSAGYKAKAAQTLSCDEASLVKNGAVVSGCGRNDVLIQSHTDPSGFSSLREKAAFDLSCDIGQLEVSLIGDSYGVTGCDKKATYVFVSGVGHVLQSVQTKSGEPVETKPTE